MVAIDALYDVEVETERNEYEKGMKALFEALMKFSEVSVRNIESVRTDIEQLVRRARSHPQEIRDIIPRISELIRIFNGPEWLGLISWAAPILDETANVLKMSSDFLVGAGAVCLASGVATSAAIPLLGGGAIAYGGSIMAKKAADAIRTVSRRTPDED